MGTHHGIVIECSLQKIMFPDLCEATLFLSSNYGTEMIYGNLSIDVKIQPCSIAYWNTDKKNRPVVKYMYVFFRGLSPVPVIIALVSLQI